VVEPRGGYWWQFAGLSVPTMAILQAGAVMAVGAMLASCGVSAILQAGAMMAVGATLASCGVSKAIQNVY
jgi:hypothetical protein